MKPTIIIEREVYAKIMHFVNKSNYEVSGLGMIKVMPDKSLRVVSAMLLPQKNGSTHTDIEAEAVGKAMFELRHSEGELKFWWHSHVKMNVFWSQTDHDTIRSFGEGGWIVATVFNQDEEMKSAYYSPDGAAMPWGQERIFCDDCPTEIPEPVFDTTQWDAEYTKNVTEQSYSNNPHNPMLLGYGKAEDWEEQKERWRDVAKTNTWTAPEKPSGMPKKQWKKLKREMRDKGIVRHLDARSNVDAYGYTQEEREFLSECGVDEMDIDAMFEYNFTPEDILQLFELGADLITIRRMMAQKIEPDAILDDILTDSITKDEANQDANSFN